MADSKYSTLPGIDTESPDVYETDDRPEEDQLAQPTTEAQEPVEGLECPSLSTDRAYNRFKDTALSAGRVDFSQGIDGRRCVGYDTCPLEYESQADRARETPHQKLLRLQQELRELTEDITHIQESAKDEAGREKLAPLFTGQQVEYLKRQIADLNLDDALGVPASSDTSEVQGNLQKRLITNLDSYKPGRVEGEKVAVTRECGTGDVGFRCEMLYKPERANFTQSAKLSNMEERLERLESVIGQNPEKLKVLATASDSNSLLGAVINLDCKLNLLDLGQLQLVEARLQSVSHKLAQISGKSKENLQQQSKICELHDAVKKWEVIADALPRISERLVIVKSLHEQALQLSRSLSQLDTGQQQITSSLTAHSDQLRVLQETMAKNNEVIKGTMTKLQSRLDASGK